MTDITDSTEEIDGPVARVHEPGLLKALWTTLSDMRTAISLLLILAAVSIVGTVVEQNAAPEMYVAKFGEAKYHILRAIGLTDVYHSAWYTLLLVLIGASLVVCSIKRLGATYRRLYRPTVASKAGQVSRMQRSEAFKMATTVSDAADKVVSVLRDRSYRVLELREADGVSLYATRGGLSVWGPYLTHLSLLVIFAGAVYGGWFGYEGYTTINEGGSTDTFHLRDSNEERPLGFRVSLRSFTVETDAKGNPTAYKSDLDVLENGKLMLNRTINVNSPLTYRGLSFFQQDYGLTGFLIRVTAPSGKSADLKYEVEVTSGEQGREYSLAGEAFRTIKLDGKKLVVFAHDFNPGTAMPGGPMSGQPAVQLMINDRFPEYKGLDAWRNLGFLKPSHVVNYKGYKVDFVDTITYSGLQVSRNPGLPVIYAGFILVLVGVVLAFYLNYKVMRIRVSAESNGASVVVGATSRGETSVFDGEFERLRESLCSSSK